MGAEDTREPKPVLVVVDGKQNACEYESANDEQNGPFNSHSRSSNQSLRGNKAIKKGAKSIPILNVTQPVGERSMQCPARLHV